MRKTQTMSRARVGFGSALAVAAIVGFGVGLTAAAPGSHVSEASALAPLAHGQSPFRVSLLPVSFKDVKGQQTLELEAMLQNRDKQTQRAIASIQIENDRGEIVSKAVVSPIRTLASDEEAFASSITTEGLSDGFYRIRSHAVFAVDEGISGSETESVYVHIQKGQLTVLPMSDWFAKSRINEVRQQ